MEDAEAVYQHVQNYEIIDEVELKVIGDQNISVGMWDKVLPRFKSNDIQAMTSSRVKEGVVYPSCDHFIEKKCLILEDTGICHDGNENKKLICDYKVKLKKTGKSKGQNIQKNKKVWRYVTKEIN